jgi:predicted RNA-binding Zn-ribbon protein involved in translation (DUF1610 family)
MEKPKDRMARPENRTPPSEATTQRSGRRGRPPKEVEEQRPPPVPTVSTDSVVVRTEGIVCPRCGRGAVLRDATRRQRGAALTIVGTCSACAHRVKRVVTRAGDDTVQALD